MTDSIGDSTGNGSSDGGSNSDGLEMNVGAAMSSMPAAATSSILAAELTISAPAAATSSQSASQTEDGGSPTTGGSSSNNYVNNNSGDGTSNGGSSGGASSGSEDTGGSNPGPASSVGSSSSGNSSAPQPVIGGHCGAYTGDKTGVASTTVRTKPSDCPSHQALRSNPSIIMTARKGLVAVVLVVPWLNGSRELLTPRFLQLLGVRTCLEVVARGVVVAAGSATN